ACVFLTQIHQDVLFRIACIGVENEVDLYAVLIADNRHRIESDAYGKLEPKHLVKGERSIEIAHPNADVIDLFDVDAAHGGLLPFIAARAPTRIRSLRYPASRAKPSVCEQHVSAHESFRRESPAIS